MKTISVKDLEKLTYLIEDDDIALSIWDSLCEYFGCYDEEDVYYIFDVINLLYSKNVYGREFLSAALLMEYLNPEDALAWLIQEVKITNFPYSRNRDRLRARRELDYKYLNIMEKVVV